MKRNILTIMAAVAALLAIGCTPENVAPEPQPNETTRNVSYVKCGEPGHATVTGDEAWHALLNTLFDAVDEGCVVSFWEAADGEGQATKESVTYRTASRDSAYVWGERMYDQGQTVLVLLDTIEYIYICSAAKVTPAPGYQPFPGYQPDASISLLHQVIERNVVLVINSQDQFDSLFPNCYINIPVNFDTQSMLVAWGVCPNMFVSTDVSVTRDGNDVTLIVDVNMSMATQPGNWIAVTACSPKVSDEQTVALEINYWICGNPL